MNKVAWLLCVAVSVSAAGVAAGEKPAPTRADALKDPVLKAMLTELDRNVSQLQLPGSQKPYFIQYRIEDVEEYSARAEFGAEEGAGHAHHRVAVVTVRVGDRKSDSSGGAADGTVEQACLSEDEIALRSVLWAASDQAYKMALAVYAQKQAALKQVQTPPQADDFSEEKPLIALSARGKLDVGSVPWPERMMHASGLYRAAEPVKLAGGVVESSHAEFHARALTTWLVNSEGTVVRKGANTFEEEIAVSTQADDGMRLARSYTSAGTALSDLDAQDVFENHVASLLGSLGDLRSALLVEEEYHGPVLLSGDASADTLRTLLGGVTAMRPRMGTEARTMGAFASSYHARVLPESLEVVDDPSLKSYSGKGLVGAYDVDDEGVPAETVKLVEGGRLQSYLIGREPVRDFPRSNGHGRAAMMSAPHPGLSVLKVTARDGMTDEALKQRLLEMAKDRGLDHVYCVETLGGVRSPRLLYRVGADGKRTLVRGAVLADLDQRALRSSVEAAGKDLWVANYVEDVPITVLAPALLMDDVTVKRANDKNAKLPFYPAPK
jgi:predicted Zn-dependent protease